MLLPFWSFGVYTFTEASGDLPLFLAQKAAIISSSGGSKFFSDTENTVKKFTFNQNFDDVYKLDFYKDLCGVNNFVINKFKFIGSSTLVWTVKSKENVN